MPTPEATLIEGGPGAGPSASRNPRHKGTLEYTKRGLVLVFFYLLWGDFVLGMMEMIIPKVLPLQLKDLGASNTVIGVLVVTLGYVFNILLNPAVSFRSDNLRTAWGRRIPYLLAVTPIITVLLIAMAFAPEIGRTAAGALAGTWLRASPNTSVIGAIAVLLVLFQVFNYCLQPVYYYLFVDVVPDAFMARFMALFKIVGTLQAYIFNSYIYGHALTHTREIYIGCALAYFVGFMAICLWVKEGEYPPPVHQKMSLGDSIGVYFRECFGIRHYLYFNLRNAFAVAAGVVGIYSVFVSRDELHLSLDFSGKVQGWTNLVALVLLYPTGILCDRLNPVRVLLPAMVLVVPINLAMFFFMHSSGSFISCTMLSLTLATLIGAAEMPFYAVILPRDRFGQFGSANQVVISVAAILASILAGRFMDWTTTNGTVIAHYRYLFLWTALFQSFAVLFMTLLYFSWKRHGGRRAYKAPEPWNDSKRAREIRGN